MKKNFTQLLFGAMLIISTSARAQDNLIISEVTDPADDYSGRFIELYNAGSEAVDFSTLTFYLSRQSNGGTSWGDVQLAGSLAAGETYVIGGSGFESLYGFAPDLLTGILIGNGDDAYCLFRDGDHSAGILQDIFGAIGIDGTGESWEYEDSRAVRVEGVTVPNTTWTAAEWEIASADIGDCDPGTHHGSEGNDTIPPGDYAISILSDTVNTGQPVEVHILVSELTVEDNIIAYQFDIDYDSLVLEYTGISVAGTIAEGGTVVANASVAGKLSVGYINTTAITGTGDILILQFNSQVIDTTDLYISNAYLNNTPVQYLTHGTITIAEIAPPTAVITYNDSINRFADTLMITAMNSSGIGSVLVLDSLGKQIKSITYMSNSKNSVTDLISFECDRDGNMIIAHKFKDLILKLNKDGEETWRKELLGGIQSKRKSIFGIVAPKDIVYKDIVCDTRGNIFVLGGSYSENKSCDIYVLTPHGEKIAVITLPEKSHCIHIDRQNNLYARASMGAGLKKYQIVYQ